MYQEGIIKKLLKNVTVYDAAKQRIEDLQRMKMLILEAQDEMPPGKIRISRTKKKVWYYLKNVDEKNKDHYLPKNDIPRLKTFLQKDYNEKILKLLMQEELELERMILRAEKLPGKIQEVFAKYPEEAQSLITPADITNEKFAEIWSSEVYVEEDFKKEYDFFTDKGERVRSKSEINIANALYKHGIPYKYECPLKLKEKGIIYPDFTVLNVRTRKQMYWEHRGRMEERNYAVDNVDKMRAYIKNNIFPGDQLILTEETLFKPLGTTEINAIIKHYLM